ncbi:hypothetical protein DICPUDRAFT_80368 [Dictyostelium purpureum]|uniref:Uncharacterized protein n=1 Tax=Dictyostelium purpureum TaxID=5786 RepID=F0ZQA0_DICPU|nr:uncharacterized protein DICPUDRAFT_80368 [Dictyostelium purpureum]EGC33853.1 hypothetical protein DICPUDRAFT_80368 [Dictyostelium purpureum]|eukprot:XP_003289591.1 hypothetical protein DICPUDRAFT_80368 [Dictyostelium purpureum]
MEKYTLTEQNQTNYISLKNIIKNEFNQGVYFLSGDENSGKLAIIESILIDFKKVCLKYDYREGNKNKNIFNNNNEKSENINIVLFSKLSSFGYYILNIVKKNNFEIILNLKYQKNYVLTKNEKIFLVTIYSLCECSNRKNTRDKTTIGFNLNYYFNIKEIQNEALILFCFLEKEDFKAKYYVKGLLENNLIFVDNKKNIKINIKIEEIKEYCMDLSFFQNFLFIKE